MKVKIIKKYEIIIKEVSFAKVEVVADTKKEAKLIVQDVLNKTDLLDKKILDKTKVYYLDIKQVK